MSSVPLPKVTRAAIVVALLVAFTSFLSGRTGPIMLFGISFVALLSAICMLLRQAWGAWGFALLLVLSILAMVFFALTGQSAGSFLQIAIGLSIYFGIAVLFFFAGLGLHLSGSKDGSPIPWVLLALLLSVPFIFFRPVSIPNASMENALQPGDFLLVDRFDTHPKFGDIIAFHYPLDRTQTFAERVVGLPGDHLHFSDGKLYRNGGAVSEPYVTHKFPGSSSMQDFPSKTSSAGLQSAGRAMLAQNVTNGDIVVPPGEYFVLGDARDTSFDSRYWGFVNQKDIIGEPRFIYDSLAPNPGDIGQAQPTHPPTRRWDRVFKSL